MDREKQNWHCLRLEVPQACCEDLSVRCFELGSCGLQTEEKGGKAHLTAYFDAELDIGAILRQLGNSFGEFQLVGVESVEEEDWEAEWRRFFRPVWATSRIVVHPSWIPLEIRPEQIAIVVDPKMAFGTGGHESTQLCLRALEECLRPGDRCLDLGTGSGVLSIAAARLGAGKILAVDVDLRAVENARENLTRNGIDSEQVEVRPGSADPLSDDRFELVLANIQSHILQPLLGAIRGLLVEGGKVLFSGLLAREEQVFCAWVEGAGLRVEKVLAKNDWICVVARRIA